MFTLAETKVNGQRWFFSLTKNIVKKVLLTNICSISMILIIVVSFYLFTRSQASKCICMAMMMKKILLHLTNYKFLGHFGLAQ